MYHMYRVVPGPCMCVYIVYSCNTGVIYYIFIYESFVLRTTCVPGSYVYLYSRSLIF